MTGVDRVQEYYEGNTRRFLRFGQGGRVGALHRAVWGPGVETRAEAFHYVEERLLDAMPQDTTCILDLGCGVGASLAYIAGRRNVRGVGVTLSPIQVELATERLAQAGLGERLSCVRADFTKLPASIEPVDFAYAIEAFVHAPAPEPFFAEAARAIRPGGVLAICDDFASDRVDDGDLSWRETRWIREFRAGWHADSLVSVRRAKAMAEAAGFTLVSDDDLTGDLELRRPRDRVITLLVRLGRHVPTRNPWWLSLLGGNALQMALVRRLLTYRVLVWTRR